MDLSIIIVNWHSADFVRECLQTILQHPTKFEFEILVIDNNSHDSCGDMLAREFPAVRFIQREQNLGFARANNIAVTHSRGDVLLFLNPDTALRGPALALMFDVVRTHADAGAVGPRLLNTDGSLQRSCVQAFPTIANLVFDADLLRDWFPRARLWGAAALYDPAAHPAVVEGISGACLMTPRLVFERIGGFAEEYFMYFEDMDYCLKANRAGHQNYYVPAAEVMHHAGKSSGGGYSDFSSIMMSESAWRFFCRQRGAGYARLFRVCLTLKAISRTGLLAAAYPIWLLRGRPRTLANAARKWHAVLQWSLGCRRQWVAQYGQAASSNNAP